MALGNDVMALCFLKAREWKRAAVTATELDFAAMALSKARGSERVVVVRSMATRLQWEWAHCRSLDWW